MSLRLRRRSRPGRLGMGLDGDGMGWDGKGRYMPFFSFMLKRRLMLARMPLPSVMVGVGGWMCGIDSGSGAAKFRLKCGVREQEVVFVVVR